jgi:hypothetical protein
MPHYLWAADRHVDDSFGVARMASLMFWISMPRVGSNATPARSPRRSPWRPWHLDLNQSEQIVVICKRGRSRQSLPILDLPLPTPPPVGAEWIEAYRRWRAEG